MNENTIFKLRNGKKLGVAFYGDLNGKPVFSFHGWPSSRLHASVFDEQARKLGVWVIAPDRPGFGISEYDPNRTLLDWPDTVEELADVLHIGKFSVLGISGGGPYAAVCAYKIPKRLKQVGIMVGIAPTYLPGMVDGQKQFFRFWWSHFGSGAILRNITAISYLGINNMSPFIDLHKFFYRSPADRKLLDDPGIRKSFLAYTHEAFRSGIRGPAYDLYLYSRDWGFDVRKIQGHVYLWYGADDQSIPFTMGKYYAEHIPHNTWKLVQNEGHMLIRTHAEEALKALIT
jgi:pimeloyl-ACP methyl ester carboxylesterase